MSKFDVWVLMAYYDQPLDDTDFSTFFTVTTGEPEPRAKVTTYDAGISGITNSSDEIMISIRLMLWSPMSTFKLVFESNHDIESNPISLRNDQTHRLDFDISTSNEKRRATVRTANLTKFYLSLDDDPVTCKACFNLIYNVFDLIKVIE